MFLLGTNWVALPLTAAFFAVVKKWKIDEVFANSIVSEITFMLSIIELEEALLEDVTLFVNLACAKSEEKLHLLILNINPSFSKPVLVSAFDGLNNLPTYGCFVIFLSVPVCLAPNS